MQYVPTILMVCGAIAAWFRAAMPLVPLLPTRWQWAPGAIVAALGALLAALPTATTDAAAITVVISSLVPLILAAARGWQGEQS